MDALSEVGMPIRYDARPCAKNTECVTVIEGVL